MGLEKFSQRIKSDFYGSLGSAAGKEKMMIRPKAGFTTMMASRKTIVITLTGTLFARTWVTR